MRIFYSVSTKRKSTSQNETMAIFSRILHSNKNNNNSDNKKQKQKRQRQHNDVGDNKVCHTLNSFQSKCSNSNDFDINNNKPTAEKKQHKSIATSATTKAIDVKVCHTLDSFTTSDFDVIIDDKHDNNNAFELLIAMPSYNNNDNDNMRENRSAYKKKTPSTIIKLSKQREREIGRGYGLRPLLSPSYDDEDSTTVATTPSSLSSTNHSSDPTTTKAEVAVSTKTTTQRRRAFGVFNTNKQNSSNTYKKQKKPNSVMLPSSSPSKSSRDSNPATTYRRLCDLDNDYNYNPKEKTVIALPTPTPQLVLKQQKQPRALHVLDNNRNQKATSLLCILPSTPSKSNSNNRYNHISHPLTKNQQQQEKYFLSLLSSSNNDDTATDDVINKFGQLSVKQQEPQQFKQKSHRIKQQPMLWNYTSNHVMVNQERVKHMLQPLIRCKDLDRIARLRAEQMAKNGNVCCNNISIHDGIVEEEYNNHQYYNIITENVAAGYCIKDIHHAMMKQQQSNGVMITTKECMNILDHRYTHMGMATAFVRTHHTDNNDNHNNNNHRKLFFCQIFIGYDEKHNNDNKRTMYDVL